MKFASGSLASASLIGVCLITAAAVRADDKNDQPNRYTASNLTTDDQSKTQRRIPIRFCETHGA